MAIKKFMPWSLAFGAAALLALCLLAFWPAAHGGFIWDDLKFIIYNPLVRADNGLIAMWTSTASEDYWPLSYSLFWLEWRLWGTETLGYHLVNILLHGAVATLLWRLMQKITGRPLLAFVIAALFAIHPVNVETVSWIFQTKTTLCALFAFAAMLCFVHYAGDDVVPHTFSGKPYIASLVFFLLSLLAKLASLFLPLVLAGYLLHRVKSQKRWRALWTLIPFFAIAAVMGSHGIWYRHLRATIGEKMFGADGSWMARPLIAARALWFYLAKALLPRDLSFVYTRWDTSLAIDAKLLAFCALCGTFVILAQSRTPLGQRTFWALAFMVAMLLPALGFSDFSFMRYAFVADHYLYLALIAPLAWGVLLVESMTLWWRNRHPTRSAALFGRDGKWCTWSAILLLFAVELLASRDRALAFRDEEALWRDTLVKNPAALLAHNNLANLLEARGAITEAFSHHEAIVTLTRDACLSPPLCAGAHFNLGRLCTMMDRTAEAIDHYQKAIALYPPLGYAHYNLGLLLDQSGRFTEAAAEIRTAIRLQPAEALFPLGLGIVLLAHDDIEGAALVIHDALRLNPSLAEGYNQLALIALKRKEIAPAKENWLKALSLDPTLLEAHVRLALLLQAEGDHATALVHMNEAHRLAPADRQVDRLLESLGAARRE